MALAATLAIYLKNAAEDEYKYTTAIKEFPTESCIDNPKLCETLPEMNCIATSGCFVKGMNSAVREAFNTCFFVEPVRLKCRTFFPFAELSYLCWFVCLGLMETIDDPLCSATHRAVPFRKHSEKLRTGATQRSCSWCSA
jgi:hypothetical protein